MSQLKVTGLIFNPPTLHSPRASKEFKDIFKRMIKGLNQVVSTSTEYHIHWSFSLDIPSHIISYNLKDFCQEIALYNYPNHKIVFSTEYMIGRPNVLKVSLNNRLIG